MKRKRCFFLPALMILLILLSMVSLCSCKPQYHVYNYQFTGTFDTFISLVGHMKTQTEFDGFAGYAEKRFNELNKLYDIYHNYDGIHNVKSINDNAGVTPVKIDKDLMDLLVFAQKWHDKTNGKMNIAFGSVLEIWHQFRTQANTGSAPSIPKMEDLQKANEHTSIRNLIINTEEGTAYLSDPMARLDVGAVAKGFATERVTGELKAKGYNSFAISAGGNVEVAGKPLANQRDAWVIGIENPMIGTQDESASSGKELIAKLAVTDTSVVTSGWYQRYYLYDGIAYHHIIDPQTLYPSRYCKAVTVICRDSGISDVLSTTLMLMPYEAAVEYLKQYPGVEAYWVLENGDIKMTGGMEALLQK